ncbi:MAG TPA: dihydrofolate reductase, partial [Kofleriaceae bacterium]|nr:dihydrofolate reductase [Kofleriaceae bacterium]
MFDVVLAADLDWGIGKAGGLPWPRLRGDLAHFRRVTTTTTREGAQNAVVMGRKTWESKEVNARPLPRRINVVVSRATLIVPDGVIAARSLDNALATIGAESTFVVGGAGLIQDALEHVALRFIYLTRIAGRFGCDVAIPDLDARGFLRDPTWEGEAIGEDNGVRYRIE